MTVIFDFDGTIADSFAVVVAIIHKLTRRSELVTPEEIVRLRRLHPLELASELGIPRWRIPFMLVMGRREMGRRIGDVQLFGGMADAIAALHRQGNHLYIMSSNSSSNVRKFLRDKGLDKYFDRKIFGGIGLHGKAKVLRRLMRQQGMAPETCIYIGDEPRDITAAKAAGMRCIAVAWGFHSPKILHDHHPYAVVKTPEELLRALQTANI